MSSTFSPEAYKHIFGHQSNKGNKMPQPTITPDNKHILKEEFKKLSDEEFHEFLHDDETNSQTALGIFFENIDSISQTRFKEVLNAEYKSRQSQLKTDYTDIYADQIDEDIETALLEAIKGSDIQEMSLFAQSKMLDRLEETADIPRVVIEAHLEQKETINEAKAVNNLLYTQINQALKVIQPIEKPEIKIDMNESVIWSVIRDNEDWLLESKLKTYLQAKKNEYQKLNIAEKSIKTEVYPDKVHELNKLQKLIYQGIKQYPDVNILSAKMDEGLERYNDIKEQFNIPAPLDNSSLSLYIRAMELHQSEEIQTLIEKAMIYLSEQAPSKPVEYSSIFDYKSIILNDITESAKNQSTPKLAWLGDYAIILKETKDKFLFNIISKPFIRADVDNSNLPNEIDETYKTAKALEKYLLSGEHIFIKDTGVVLWWSASNKVFMIDMEKATWDELYKVYKQESKRGSIDERNDPKSITFRGGSGADREEIIDLAAEYNFFTHMITSYAQEKEAKAKNEQIRQALKALQVTEISSGSNSIKI